MDISQEHRSGVTIFTVTGRLDSESSPELERVLAAVPDDGRVVLNLPELGYVSSAGLRVLLALVKRLGPRSGHLALCSLTPAVRQLLNLTGLTGAFGIEASLDAAVARVGGS